MKLHIVMYGSYDACKAEAERLGLRDYTIQHSGKPSGCFTHQNYVLLAMSAGK